MIFKEAFELMKQGAKVKLPGWNGYWCWDNDKQTIMIHCRPKDSDKGQGDVLEASTRIYAQSMTVYDPLTNEVLKQIDNSIRFVVRMRPAEDMPVFCLFAVLDKDCELDDDGKFRIRLF